MLVRIKHGLLSMIQKSRRSLADYLTELQSQGRIVFAAEDAVHTLGTNRGAFLDAAQRRQRQGKLIVRRQGFWDRWLRDLREGQAHLSGLIMRRICGESNVAFRWSFV